MKPAAFPRHLTDKTAKQAKHTILRGALLQMGRINPGNAETYDTRLLYLKTDDSVAYRLFMLLADALNGAACVSPQHAREPETRQRARDWLDALDAYLDRKYPEKPCQTEPSAPAGAKGTSGAPTPPSDAGAAASGCASTGSTGSGPGALFGREQVLEAMSTLDNLKLARGRLPHLQSLTAGTGICSFMINVLNELELHREALKRIGQL